MQILPIYVILGLGDVREKPQHERKIFMSFDGITTKSIVNELNNTLTNSRIEKIYVPNKSEIILSVHTQDRNNVKLLISIDANNSRLQLTNGTRENPITAPQFCMILRKYMQGGKILEITQKDLDRVIFIRFENINDFGDYVQKQLVIELMGKYSNVILIDEDKIIDSMKHVTSFMSSVREVLPGRKYIVPSSLGKLNFLETSFQEFENSLEKELSISNAIANKYVGISKSFLQGACITLNLDENELVANTSTNKLMKVYDYIKEVITNIQLNQINVTFTTNGKDYYITNASEPSFTSCSQLLDQFYSSKEQVSILKNAKLNIEREINTQLGKLNKKLTQSLEILKEEDNLEKYRQYGDLISSNIYRMKIGMEKLEVENFYDNNKMIEIPLISNRTPAQNAQQYFKKYAKLKKSILYAAENKQSYEKDIHYLESVLFNLQEAQVLNEVDDIRDELISSGIMKKNGKRNKHRDLPSEPIRYEKDGIEILVGRNNLQNDKLTFKIARKTDTWLHAKKIHGSHVIIRSNDIPDEVLLYAAQIAAKHSQAKDASRVEVDYTLVKYVHKESGSKPGMVVYTDYNSIIV